MKTAVGYTGGKTESPTYDSVCRGDGHTEAMRIWYDTTETSYEVMLEAFFKNHSPTGRKPKPQYKSAIYYHSEAQRLLAKAALEAYASKNGPVHTDLEPEQPWTDAEDYHQQYLFKPRGGSGVSSGWL